MVLKLSSLGGQQFNGFNIDIGSSGNTTADLGQVYESGGYIITSQSSDNAMDIYAIAEDGSFAGHTSSKSLSTTKDFNKIVVFGATPNDLLTFEYKNTVSPTSIGTDTSASPFVLSTSESNMIDIDDTTIISGGNFASGVQVYFVGSDNVQREAKSVVRSSVSELIVTRPDTLPPAYSPYSIRLINPGVNSASGTNVNVLPNSISSGTSPVWSTTSINGIIYNIAYSFTLSATDADGGSITYSIVSGSLPTGITLNSSTGVVSGTASVASGYGTSNITFRATDSGGNYLDKQLSLSYFGEWATGGTVTDSGGYRYHTFNSSGTLSVNASKTMEYIIVAGGGGGSAATGGGGGAGGALSGSTTVSGGNYTITIGAGAAANTNAGRTGFSGSNSTGLSLTAIGGGGGAGSYQGAPTVSAFGEPAAVGGSGGGGGAMWPPSGVPAGTISYGASGTAGQGNAGGNGFPAEADYSTYATISSGGGGGANAAGQNAQRGTGGAGGAGKEWPASSGVYYAGGGAGGSNTAGTGGIGGGGNGGANGQANKGGGGGNNAAGGSGIVIVRYIP